jgi:ribosome-associated protein
MKRDLVIQPGLIIPESELSLGFSLSRGPGGQNVQKNETRSTMTWNVAESAVVSEWQRRRLLEKVSGAYKTISGEIHVSSEKERSRLRNVRECESKLAELVRTALKRPKPRRATKPSRASKEKRLVQKKQRGKVKELRKKNFDD